MNCTLNRPAKLIDTIKKTAFLSSPSYTKLSVVYGGGGLNGGGVPLGAGRFANLDMR